MEYVLWEGEREISVMVSHGSVRPLQKVHFMITGEATRWAPLHCLAPSSVAQYMTALIMIRGFASARGSYSELCSQTGYMQNVGEKATRKRDNRKT
jgi:hypothetical protein